MDRDISRIPNPFIPLLISTRVEDICPKTSVFSIDAYSTVADLGDLLRSHAIHSVPILENGTCLGMVDGLDIARFFFQDPATFPTRVKSTKVISLILPNTAQLPVFSNTTLLDVIAIVAPGVHRAIVLRSESDHSLFSVCSESDIIATLYCFAKLQNPSSANIQNKPVHIVCSLPICVFSNYLARVKFHVDSSDSIENAIRHITTALQSTTVQQQAGAVVSADSHPSLLPTDSESMLDQVEIIIDHPSLEWNAPIVVVINQEQNAIMGYLNSTTMHTNLVQTKDASNLCSNYEKTVQDYLGTVQAVGSTKSLGFVVKHTITFGQLIQLFTEKKLDYVWVFTRKTLSETVVGKDTSTAATGQAATDNGQLATTMHGMKEVIKDFCWELGETMPAEWYTTNSLAMITINDLLRLISRDNISLYTRLIPALAPQ